MRHHAARRQLVAAQIDRLGVALLVYRIGGEQRAQKLGIRQRAAGAGRRRAGHVVGRLDGELELVRHRLQAVRLLVHAVAKLLGQFAELGLRLLRAQLVLELGAHLLEWRHRCRLNLGQLDDVVAEIAFDQIAQVARLGQAEGGLRDRRIDALVALKQPQVAAAGRAGIVLRRLARHVGKSAGRLAQLSQQGGGRALGFLAFSRRRILGRRDQDVAGAPLLGRAKGGGILVVIGAQVLLAHAHGLLHAVQIQHDVLDLGRFGRLVARDVRLVVGLQLGLRRIDLGGVASWRERHDAHFAPLQKRIHCHIGLRLTGETAVQHTRQHLARRQIAPHVGLESFGCEPLRGQQLAVTLHVQTAVGAAQRGNGRVTLQVGRQPRIGRHQVLVGRCGGQHALLHQTLQRGALERGRIQQRQVQRGVGGAQAIHFHAVRVVPFGLRDGLAVDSGHLGAAIVEPRIAFEAEQHKRRNDQQKQHTHDELGVPADEVEHARNSRSMRSRENEKGEPGFAFAQRVGTWWVLRGSNPRPTPCKGAALPTELSTPPD